MSAITDSALSALANTVQNETVAGANSATRVGVLFNNLVDSKQNILNAIVTVKVSLLSTEILALFTTPKVLVAAQGVNTVLVPIRILINQTYNSVVYATNTTLIVAGGTIFSTNLSSALGFSSNQLATFTLSTNATGSPASSTNTALTLTTLGGNPTAGNSIIDVYLTYAIITL